jgi:EmrB/QacA subfamily drug resistance transporter
MLQQHTTEATKSHQTAVLMIVLVSYLMILLDISIVITALPKIERSLGFTPVGLSWVQSAYTLAFGSLLLLGARAGDILGRRRMFVTGLSIFIVASLAIGVAQSATWLICARAVQGIGSAILAPSTLALLTTHFAEGPERTRAVGYYGAAAGIGGSVGLALGGVFAEWFSWRVGFFINLPIGIALILGAQRYLKETEKRSGNLDLAGAITSTLGMSALVYGLVQSATLGWTDPTTVASLTLSVVLLTLFVMIESRAAQPIMPLRLFASRERSGAYAARMLFLGGMIGFWFFTTQFLQGVLGFSPFEAGIAFLPMTLVNFATAMTVPRLTQRFGNGRLLAVGLTITALGMACLSRLSIHTSYVVGVALPMVLIGMGQGCTLSPLTAAAINGVTPEDAGAASGVVNVAHQLGGSLGLSILIVVFAAAGSSALDAHQLLAQRIAAALTGSTVMLVFALLIVLAMIVRPHKVAVSGAPGN